ncbi:MAG: hypothetical protein ACQERN_08545 [Thermodesulfobacteriota bacterium]
MKFFRKLFLILALLGAISIGALGCGNDNGMEETGEEATETMEEAGEEAGEAVEDAGDKAEEATE